MEIVILGESISLEKLGKFLVLVWEASVGRGKEGSLNWQKGLGCWKAHSHQGVCHLLLCMRFCPWVWSGVTMQNSTPCCTCASDRNFNCLRPSQGASLAYVTGNDRCRVICLRDNWIQELEDPQRTSFLLSPAVRFCFLPLQTGFSWQRFFPLKTFRFNPPLSLFAIIPLTQVPCVLQLPDYISFLLGVVFFEDKK